MSKAWRWQSPQPIAAWIARCRPPSVMVEGTSSRRQIGGFAPRSVTLRLTMVVPALVFSVLVFDLLVLLATIFASCQLGHRSQCPQSDAAQRSVASAFGRG